MGFGDRLFVENDALLNQNTPIWPQLSRRENCECLFSSLVKGVPFDFCEGHMFALLLIDDFLEFLLYLRDFIRVMHYFHSQRWIIDKRVERNQTETGFQRGWGINSVQSHKSLCHRNSGEMCVDNCEIVSVSHRG